MGKTVFISWSGERSRYVAEALREWLPLVLQIVEPWISTEDVGKGKPWQNEIMGKLDEPSVGIVCLTPENLDSPWLLFEAGALGKQLGKSGVCTYLLDLTPAQVPQPLGMFQHTAMLKEETRKLLHAINSAQANPLPKEILDRSFGPHWPWLEEKFKHIPLPDTGPKPKRELEDMVAEVLEIARALPTQVEVQVVRALNARRQADLVTRNIVQPASPFTGFQVTETPLPLGPGTSSNRAAGQARGGPSSEFAGPPRREPPPGWGGPTG